MILPFSYLNEFRLKSRTHYQIAVSTSTRNNRAEKCHVLDFHGDVFDKFVLYTYKSSASTNNQKSPLPFEELSEFFTVSIIA